MKKFWMRYIGTLVLYLLLAYMLLFVIFEINELYSVFIFVLWTMVMLFYTTIAFRFGSGVKQRGGSIHIPTLSGGVIVDPDGVTGYETEKWLFGRVFGYTRATLHLKNCHEVRLILPDELLEQSGLRSTA